MQIVDEKSFKILAISENLTYRNNLCAKLRFEGFSVEYADGGFHLLHLLERENEFGANLVIIHENMHDMPAHEIISLIRTFKDKTELPIIFISKDKKEEEICDIIFLGANEFLVQATNFAAVVERTKKYFNQRVHS